MTAKQTAVKKYVVKLSDAEREQLSTLIRSGKHRARQLVRARILLKADACKAGEGWSNLKQVLDRAAVLFAFEQLGGADRTLEMARDYALDRIAFGRPIGSFQAIKHILADMYVSATLARSNCYYGAWALSTNSSELAEAAAGARISATEAFQHSSKQNIQVHGGMGFTWEFDCHLYYRRSAALALALGSRGYWEDQLIDRMRQRNAA